MFDSHCHLTDDRFAEDREEVFFRAHEAGVRRVVTIASDLSDSLAAIKLAAEHPDTWCSVGIHPHEVERAHEGDERRLVDLAGREEVVALGETGLDYFYDNAPRVLQREWFGRHLGLAAELALPVVVHTREADRDTMELLDSAVPEVATVLHCFTGGMELLEFGLERGSYVSFSGIVSFGKFDGHDAVRHVPRDRLLVETDSPYLAPVPRRGKRNEPGLLPHVIEAVAALRGEDASDVAEYTSENAARFYGI
ncbi:MAG: TatD family hydrolase [Gemmatimonadota bacterium]|nr:MAG: TatD family hydrolase [Gemmatimonadota bacterium]